MIDYTNKTVLILGCAGSIGTELVIQAYRKHPKVLLILDQDETRLFELSQDLPRTTPILADIRDEDVIKALFKQYKPDIVFHAAAYKHVGFCEKFPQEAYKTNVKALANLIKVSSDVSEKFIFISTDKAVDPSCVMGHTKKQGEEMCIEANSKSKTAFISVRFGNVLASRGSVLSIWKKQLKREQKIEITDERMERYFMTVFEACELVLESTEMGEGGELYIFDMGEPIKIKDLAEQFIRLSGERGETKIIGIRDGEKLTEKLLSDDEKVEKTAHNKILKVIKI